MGESTGRLAGKAFLLFLSVRQYGEVAAGAVAAGAVAATLQT